MLSKTTAEKALAKALVTGGDFAEIFYEDTRANSMQMMDGVLDSAVTSRDHGAGVRVFSGTNSVYVYTNDTSESGLVDAADKAAQAVGAVSGDTRVALHESLAQNAHPIAMIPSDVSGKRKVKRVRQAYTAAKEFDAVISQVRVGLIDTDRLVTIANSEGLYIGDRRVYTRLSVSAVASENGENQTGFEGPGAMMGFEIFDSRVDVEACAKSAAQIALTMLRAPVCPAGVMPVVIDGGFGGVIFHEACGHSLEATSVAKQNSEFCGKLGMRVAGECVTAIDDGTLPNEWGSLNIDDEGMATGRLTLIERGILKNYMIDRMGARRMGMSPTGSARRQNYTYAPTSRMRNTFIAAGKDDERRMIRTMGDGLYAKRMGGGSVNPVTGEFNFAVMEGYLVKDGKIAGPVRGATLVGKGSEVLLRIDKVGREMTMAQGMCGSASGSVPTNVGQPMIRVTQLTVGGR